MIKKYLILLLYITNFLLGDFIPEDNSSINYTQVFFKWSQIENAESYVLNIQNSLYKIIIFFSYKLIDRLKQFIVKK